MLQGKTAHRLTLAQSELIHKILLPQAILHPGHSWRMRLTFESTIPVYYSLTSVAISLDDFCD